ncbi:MAG: M48 family metalloprotease, partial [Deltaproteobacteria bacterium]|nr:M48 family metalloprotease [Deltaproteobacteria bacterium]
MIQELKRMLHGPSYKNGELTQEYNHNVLYRRSRPFGMGVCKNMSLSFSTLKRHVIFILTFLIIFCTAGVSHAAFTIDDEVKLGKEFYEKLEKSQVLVRNEKINIYITNLGHKILAQSQKAPFDFRFLVIKSSAINAFATPGGYVYVNRGLINIVENESELAGILAHEIAHVN